MVEGVAQGRIGERIAEYAQIGENHLGENLSQKTTNFIGRGLSQIFSKESNNKSVSNLIADIRKNPEFGDRCAILAQAKLNFLVGSGKPLTGRVASQVLSEIVAIKSNIDINLESYVDEHAPALMEEVFKKEQKGIGAELMDAGDKAAIKDKAVKWLKSELSDLQRNAPPRSPSGNELARAFDSFCLSKVASQHCRAKIEKFNTEKINGAVKNFGDEIKARFSERGEGKIVLSDLFIRTLKNEVRDALIRPGQDYDRLYKGADDPVIAEIKTRVMDTHIAAFTSITETEGMSDDNKQIMKEQLALKVAHTKDLKPEIYTDAFLADNPGLVRKDEAKTRAMVQDIYTNIPRNLGGVLNHDALWLATEHILYPEGPVDARVVIDRTDPENLKPVLSYDIASYFDDRPQFMEAAFRKEQGGIGARLMSEEDKTEIKHQAVQGLRQEFGHKLPSEGEMRSELTAIAREHCRVKIMDHNDAKINESVANLGQETNNLFEQSGEKGFKLSGVLIKEMEKKIFEKLTIAGDGKNILYGNQDPDIEAAKKEVMKTMVGAFTCINEVRGVPDNVKQTLKDTLASGQILLTEGISLSAIQGYQDGICDGIAQAVNNDDRSDETLIHFIKTTLGAMDNALKSPDTQTNRRGIDGYSRETVKFCLCTIAMKTNGIDQAKVRTFYDACMAASGRQEDMNTRIAMESLAGHMALAAGIKPGI